MRQIHERGWMRTTLALAVCLAASHAYADVDLGLHVGVGAPTGGFGVSVREGDIEVLVEGQALVLGMAALVSASAQFRYQFAQWGRWGLYAGPAGGTFAFLACCEGSGTSSWGVVGGVIGIRTYFTPTRVNDFEIGALYGVATDQPCDADCEFVSLQAAWRLHFYL